MAQSKDIESIIEIAFWIRQIEILLLNFSSKSTRGTVHTCLGQELNAAVFFPLWKSDDRVFSNHRGHGHFVSRELFHADKKKKFSVLKKFVREVQGFQDGINSGRAGTQHISTENFIAHGVLGAMWPVSFGFSLGLKHRKSQGVSVLFSGEGAFGEGIVYETLNWAGIKDTPLFIVVENNKVSQSTDSESVRSGSIEARVRAFQIEYRKVSGSDLSALYSAASAAMTFARQNQRALVLEIETTRLGPHSKIANTTEQVNLKSPIFKDDELTRLLNNDYSAQAQMWMAEWHEFVQGLDDFSAIPMAPQNSTEEASLISSGFHRVEYSNKLGIEKVREALELQLKNNSQMILAGEDIEDPYGGAFKATATLSSKFPKRVFNTPISEAALTGMGIGLALSGTTAWIEVMFGDFLTLAFDQLLNVASKIPWISEGRHQISLVVRAAIGSAGGYGSTHSQSLEKHFLGIPNLDVVALNHLVPVTRIFESAANSKKTVLLLEHKRFYKSASTFPKAGFQWVYDQSPYPTAYLVPDSPHCDVILFGYGYFAQHLQETANILFEKFDLITYVVCPSKISGVDIGEVLKPFASLKTAKILITFEEGIGFSGWGSEICAQANEYFPKIKTRRVSAKAVPLGASPEREAETLPKPSDIIEIIRSMLGELDGTANV